MSAWLADAEAQRTSFARVQERGARWGVHPLMSQLQRKLSELAEPDVQTILAYADEFMDQTEAHQALYDDMISGCRADPFFEPPFYPLTSDIHTGLLLFQHPFLSIAIGITSVDALAAKKRAHGGIGAIGFSGQITKFRYLKAGGATLSFWEAEPATADFVAAQAPPARFAGERRLHDGDELLLDGARQTYIVEHATSDLVYLQALIRHGGAPLAVTYDRDTLQFLSATTTDEASSRTQMMVSLLRAMDREDAVPLMERELDSPHFNTRWHVMREMLALDAETALPALKRMAAGDPHPEVRAAAASTLAMFFPGQETAPCPA